MCSQVGADEGDQLRGRITLERTALNQRSRRQKYSVSDFAAHVLASFVAFLTPRIIRHSEVLYLRAKYQETSLLRTNAEKRSTSRTTRIVAPTSVATLG